MAARRVHLNLGVCEALTFTRGQVYTCLMSMKMGGANRGAVYRKDMQGGARQSRVGGESTKCSCDCVSSGGVLPPLDEDDCQE